AAHVMEYCNAAAWTSMSGGAAASSTIVNDGAGGRRWSDGTYATSCDGYQSPTSSLYVYAGMTGDGIYTISIAGVQTQVFCNMTDQGGGWTLLASHGPSCGNYFSAGNWQNTANAAPASPKNGPCSLYSIWN